MKGKIFIVSALIALVLLFGCIDSIKEIVQLPIAGEDMETDTFTHEFAISGTESIELSGVYAKITTDNAQIKDLVYTASLSGSELGSEVSFLGSAWTLTMVDCSSKEVGLTKQDSSLTLKDSTTYDTEWEVSVACADGELDSVALDLNRAKVMVEGDVLFVPDASGISLEYLGKGALEVK